MIKTNSVQLNAAVHFPETFLERCDYFIAMFLLLLNASVPAIEAVLYEMGERRSVARYIGVAILVVTGIFYSMRGIASKYTHVKPQPEDYFQVFGDRPIIYPTGIYGKIMLWFNVFLLSCSIGQMVWLIYAVWISYVTPGFAIFFLVYILLNFLSSLAALGWFNRFPLKV